MAPVDDVVPVVSLEQDDRRKRHAFPVRTGDPLPPYPQTLRGWTEPGIELHATVKRANDATRVDNLQSAWPRRQRVGERKSPRTARGALPGREVAPEPAGGVGAAGATKVILCVDSCHSRRMSI